MRKLVVTLVFIRAGIGSKILHFEPRPALMNGFAAIGKMRLSTVEYQSYVSIGGLRKKMSVVACER